MSNAPVFGYQGFLPLNNEYKNIDINILNLETSKKF